MIKTALVFGLLGLIAFSSLFAWQGLGPIKDAFAAAGVGILWIAAAHFLSMTMNARAWQLLLPLHRRPSTLIFLWAVWLRESVNGLLPVARIGGEIVSANLFIRRGTQPSLAIAGLIGDVTITLVTQFLFTLIGIGLLALKGINHSSLRDVLIGGILILPLGALFILIQNIGLFKIFSFVTSRLFGDRFISLAGNAASLDLKIKRIYRRRSAVFFCGLWQMGGWCTGAVEIWLSLYFLGHQTSFLNAIIIESLIQAISSSAFIVPGALGVQEGGFLLLGQFLGFTPETALALALLRRVRDVTLFVPALAIWQFGLGKRLFSKNVLMDNSSL